MGAASVFDLPVKRSIRSDSPARNPAPGSPPASSANSSGAAFSPASVSVPGRERLNWRRWVAIEAGLSVSAQPIR
jgi:hypothetical protein